MLSDKNGSMVPAGPVLKPILFLVNVTIPRLMPYSGINKGWEVKKMGFGYGGGYDGAVAPGPYFDGSFILFLILILLVFGTGFGSGGYYGADK